MTYYCCTYTDNAKTRISRYVRNEEEMTKICNDVRRQGYTPIKTKVSITSETVRTEVKIR